MSAVESQLTALERKIDDLLARVDDQSQSIASAPESEKGEAQK